MLGRAQAVAEGIETREQAEALAANGCAFAQGYYFGRPVDAAEFDRERVPAYRP